MAMKYYYYARVCYQSTGHVISLTFVIALFLTACFFFSSPFRFVLNSERCVDVSPQQWVDVTRYNNFIEEST